MGEEVKYIVQKLPVLNKRIILKKNMVKGNIRVLKPAFKEEVVFEADKCDFLPGEYQKFKLFNRVYYANNKVKTIAKIETKSGTIIERTSEDIVKLIGQANYDTAFSSICSVFNQELKIRGILSLLTVPKEKISNFVQVELKGDSVETTDQSSQTDDKDLTVKSKIHRRKRQALTPYVVKDTPEQKLKKVVISPDEFKKLLPDLKTEPDQLPELPGRVFDENSNDSIGNLSSLSCTTTPELLKNPSLLLNNIDKHMENVLNDDKDYTTNEDIHTYQNLESPLSVSTVPASPSASEKCVITKSMLNQMMPEQRRKLAMKQAAFDWKNCLHRDEDGYLPIHVAVLNNDLDLLRRQCIILKIRNENVDIPATGGLTALKMSLYEDNGEATAMLLNFGADPLSADEDNRTPFHIAAEMAGDHMQALINHCKHHARQILHDEELWKPELEGKSDEDLSKYLFNHICSLYDSQGYTPLILASKLGRYTNVRQLVEVAPDTVNIQMPNSGNTALYIAVGAASMDSAERGNRAKLSDNFRQTLEVLLENGSDPNIANFSNSNVNDLVIECTCVELSMLVANKLTAVKFGKNFDSFMFVKDKDGKVNMINRVRNSRTKPFIVANELYKPGTSVAKKTPAKGERIFGKNVGNSEGEATGNDIDRGDSDNGVVKNYKLNKPLIIKTELSKNKRKLELSIEPETQVKKTTKNNT